MKLALCELVNEAPDLVLSGINHGPNLGTDVFCSGTVAAAMEGTLEGIRSLAVSSACFQWRQFQAAADLALDVAEQAHGDQWPENLLLNLNIPLRQQRHGSPALDPSLGAPLRGTIQPPRGSPGADLLLALR